MEDNDSESRGCKEKRLILFLESSWGVGWGAGNPHSGALSAQGHIIFLLLLLLIVLITAMIQIKMLWALLFYCYCLSGRGSGPQVLNID